MNEEGLENLVSVQAAGLRSVASDDPLGVFDSELRPLVGSGMIGRGDSVNNAEPGAEILELVGGEDLGPI